MTNEWSVCLPCGRSCDSNAQIRTLVKSNQGLENLYLSVPSQALDVIRIRQLLLAQCQDNLTGVDIKSGLLVGQHYEVATSAHSHKSVPILK